jgi:hypothetical protein
LGTEDGGSVVVGPPVEGIDVVLLAPATVVVVVLVVATPAQVASVEHASDVVNTPSAAPQAVPFLHTAGDRTIEALTLPFLLSVQHTAAFGFPQMDALSHRSTSARQRFSGRSLMTPGSFNEPLTHLLYLWCVWPGCAQPQVLSSNACAASIDTSSVHRASPQSARAREPGAWSRSAITTPAAGRQPTERFLEEPSMPFRTPRRVACGPMPRLHGSVCPFQGRSSDTSGAGVNKPRGLSGGGRTTTLPIFVRVADSARNSSALTAVASPESSAGVRVHAVGRTPPCA